MSNSKQNNELLSRLAQVLVTLFTSNTNVSDDDITRTIEIFNTAHHCNLRWNDATTIISRLQSVYPASNFPKWIPERFQFVKTLATGTTSRVILAIDRVSGKQLAIKLLKPVESFTRIKREAEILRKLNSPYIVQLNDAIFNFDNPLTPHAALVMEFIDGHYLNQVINQNKRPPHELNDAISWMIQTAVALTDAHTQGVIHRDIKPANLVVAHETRLIKLLDFGLAANLERSSSLTNSGDLMGSPHYIAPEQSRDPTILDPRNDIYSYGATFYHLLTGTTPFQGDYIDLVAQHRHSSLAPPKSRNPKIPKLVNHVIEKCMAKQAPSRFNSFAEILDEFKSEEPGKSLTCSTPQQH